ncbi:unnamed protein product [Cutaneotrichosporon oleaginosum]
MPRPSDLYLFWAAVPHPTESLAAHNILNSVDDLTHVLDSLHLGTVTPAQCTLLETLAADFGTLHMPQTQTFLLDLARAMHGTPLYDRKRCRGLEELIADLHEIILSEPPAATSGEVVTRDDMTTRAVSTTHAASTAHAARATHAASTTQKVTSAIPGAASAAVPPRLGRPVSTRGNCADGVGGSQ